MIEFCFLERWQSSLFSIFLLLNSVVRITILIFCYVVGRKIWIWCLCVCHRERKFPLLQMGLSINYVIESLGRSCKRSPDSVTLVVCWSSACRVVFMFNYSESTHSVTQSDRCMLGLFVFSKSTKLWHGLTTWSLTCVCDHSHCERIYIRGVGVRYTDRESAQHFWLENILVLMTAFELGSWNVKSDALPIEPTRKTMHVIQRSTSS